MAYSASWSFADFPAQLSSLIQHGARILWYHDINADGGASAGQAEISGTADCAKTKANDDRHGASGASGYLSVVYCAAYYWAGDDVQPGNPWIAFGIVMPHAAEANFDLVDMLEVPHVTLANPGYFVIGLHAAAALMHHYFWKDNTLLRHDAA